MKSKLAFAAILCVFVTSTMSCSLLGQGPGAVVKSFLYAVDKGRTDAAMDYISVRVKAQLNPEKMKAGLQSQTQDFKAKDGIDSIEVLQEKETGDVADVSVRVTYGNGTTEIKVGKLVKEDGAWKIGMSK